MLNFDKKELSDNCVQFGGLTKKWNPQMKNYIYGKSNRNKSYTIDMEKIISSCEGVSEYVKNLLFNKEKTILFLSTTKKQVSDAVKENAIKCGMPYIVKKWKGGFLTNFKEISKKIKELQGINIFLQKEDAKNLPKKEKINLERKKEKLMSIYEGVINLKKQPDAIFIIGLNKAKTALKEAKKMGIPIIAVCNTNSNPNWVDFAIFGNDENPKSINFFSSLLSNSIQEAKK